MKQLRGSSPAAGRDVHRAGAVREAGPGYQCFPRWRDYLAHFPDAARLAAAVEPVEQWWPWQGHRIHLDRYPGPGGCAKALILHGGASYGRMLFPYARILAEAGFEVVVPDLPGYGLTRVAGHALRHESWLCCVRDLARAEHLADGRPLTVLGLSMSGLIAVQAAAMLGPDVVRTVVVSSLLDPTDRATTESMARWQSLVGPLSAATRHSAAFDRFGVPVRWLADVDRITNNVQVNALIKRDPQGGGGRVSWRFARTYLQCDGASGLSLRQGQELVLALPSDDRLAPARLSQEVFARVGGAKRVVRLDGAGHMPVEPGPLRLLADLAAEIAEGRRGRNA